MKEKKVLDKKKRSWLWSGLIVSTLVIGTFMGMLYSGQVNNFDEVIDQIVDIVNPDTIVEETSWHKIATVYPFALGENDPGAGVGGWLSFFILDYAQDPATVLGSGTNATDWSSDATARGYADSDDWDEDLKANDPGYFVCRCRFDDTAKNGSTWDWDRFRVNLTVGGTETISDVGVYDNVSDTDGGAAVSNSQSDMIWINFWWTDNDDGYIIASDGSLSIALTIYEKY